VKNWLEFCADFEDKSVTSLPEITAGPLTSLQMELFFEHGQ
jgi:hypothetical protein